MRDHIPIFRAASSDTSLQSLLVNGQVPSHIQNNMEQRVEEYLKNYMTTQLSATKYIIYFTIPMHTDQHGSITDTRSHKMRRIQTDHFRNANLPSIETVHHHFPRFGRGWTPLNNFPNIITTMKPDFERLAKRTRLALDKLDYGTLQFKNDNLDFVPQDAEIPEDELISYFMFATFKVPSLQELVTRDHIKLNRTNLKRFQKAECSDDFLKSIFPENVIDAVKAQKRNP